MCFWFGLEILRLVYKKVFFEILNSSILFDLSSFEKKSRVWQKGQNFFQKNWIFRDLENFAKYHFSEKNLGELLDARVLHIFEISTKFRFFWYPARPISKKFFSTLIRDVAVFLEGKSSNKIETDQYFKRRFFIN